jgi:hypothetical protein
VVLALTAKPLNACQEALLIWHARNFAAGGGPLSVADLAKRLDAEQMADPSNSVALVIGAYRSLGQRLAGKLTSIPNRLGRIGWGMESLILYRCSRCFQSSATHTDSPGTC